jgi:pantoate--beta-alanine ligase
LELIKAVNKMHEIALSTRKKGANIALVPTMGYLHQGHASLMQEGRKHSDLLVASIFVNPVQFGVGEDLDNYPKDLERDRAIAAEAGVDFLFAPSITEMYPSGYQTYVNVEQLTLPLCGNSRPGHFRGVTSVVAKLFGITQPHIAFFGKKDFQQLAVIRQMTADLNIPVKIIGMPIVREYDGLAMSSRNAYLSAHERSEALCLKLTIDSVKRSFRDGITSSSILKNMALQIISKSLSASVDYIEFCDSLSLETVVNVDSNTLIALAVKIGKTRLIDNSIMGEE